MKRSFAWFAALLCAASLAVRPAVAQVPDPATGQDAETYRTLAFDGAWCWFSDPRAVYHEGRHRRTYAGWIDSYGDVTVGYLDHETGKIRTHVLHDGLEVDDHDNPALIFDPTGRLLVFFSKHSSRSPISLYIAAAPEQIDAWEPVRTLDLNPYAAYPGWEGSYTYVNPVYLPAEDRFYLFWRGIDSKPTFATSDDHGRTWSAGRLCILPERSYAFRRPYLKVAGNGRDKIFFAFTDGHPRNEPTNAIYCMYYQAGSYYRIDGTRIGAVEAGPVAPADASRVYDAAQGRAWVWDIAVDAEDRPALVYARFPDDSTHIYCHARWDGRRWQTQDLADGGGWFPETPAGTSEREPHYAGGVVLDHEDPQTLYLSVRRDSVFEIERWQRGKGKNWQVTALTRGSRKDNIRPVAVRNATGDNPLQVLWLCSTRYVHYTDYQTAVQTSLPLTLPPTGLDSASVWEVMHRVADWQLMNPREAHKLDWHYGAFYTGVWALYQRSGEARYRNELTNLGQHHHWKLLNDIYHADRLTIAQPLIELYQETGDPAMFEKIHWVMDMHVDRTAQADVRFEGNNYFLEWWTWCDALFMAPPTFARAYAATGDSRYLDYLDKHWWITSDYLYSTGDSLYYRDDRFFTQRSDNGRKLFWARGNGWVIAGLARTIPYLPADDPRRARFVEQYRQMAARLRRIQGADGLWRVSLDDPAYLDLGESSGSAFFTFALAWGINYGLLDRTQYLPVVQRAWQALAANVDARGRLGFVQQVAGSPYPFYADQSHVYASGAFLLAGAELLKLAR
ncbi:MAG: hypothetical protein OHK0039_47780 [Bacteroidia bacterium]